MLAKLPVCRVTHSLFINMQLFILVSFSLLLPLQLTTKRIPRPLPTLPLLGRGIEIFTATTAAWQIILPLPLYLLSRVTDISIGLLLYSVL